jgi:peptidoglycan biosynthesis protein MviN/MurJ (putative lipid II flippase)
MAVGRPFIGLLVGHGGVAPDNLDLLYLLLLGLGGVLIGAVGQLLASTFYSFGDTKTPTRARLLTKRLRERMELEA